MSEITTTNKSKGGNRCTRKSTRVDLTPMVDLGFLLITFFVFTTTMATTTAMGMVSPKETDIIDSTEIPESTVITLIPAANDKLYYYEGSDKNAIYKTTNYTAAGMRTLLVNKKKIVEANGKDAILIIKPSKFSSFKNLVNIIDESKICMYKRYYLDKLDAAGEAKIK